MNSVKKPNPEAFDAENPELTAEEMRRARPAREVFGAEGWQSRMNETLRAHMPRRDKQA
jgi:uncharacterized protein (DUF4415 family)